MRLLGSKRIELVRSPSAFGEEDEAAERKQAKPKQPAPTGLAVAFDLDRATLERGPGAEVWLAAVGDLPRDGDGLRPNPLWLAQAAAIADVALFLGSDRAEVAATASRARALAGLLGLEPPRTFVGPYPDDLDAATAAVAAGHGLLIRPRADREPEIEAERLRRALSCLPEDLLLSGDAAWSSAPQICCWAAPEVLAALPRPLVAWAYLEASPPMGLELPGRLLVAADSEYRPAWGETPYLLAGPECLRWRPWARAPGSVR